MYEVDVTRADIFHVPEAAVLIAHVGTNIRYCFIPNDEKLKLTIDSIIGRRNKLKEEPLPCDERAETSPEMFKTEKQRAGFFLFLNLSGGWKGWPCWSFGRCDQMKCMFYKKGSSCPFWQLQYTQE